MEKLVAYSAETEVISPETIDFIGYCAFSNMILSHCADIVGKVNADGSATLRMVAAARSVAAERVLRLIFSNQQHPVTKKTFELRFDLAMIGFVASDSSLEEVGRILTQIIRNEDALVLLEHEKHYVTGNPSQIVVMNEIASSAETASRLLKKVVVQIYGDKGPYFCQNCLAFHDIELRTNCLCGASSAWLRPLV